jgi:hypothetical protein
MIYLYNSDAQDVSKKQLQRRIFEHRKRGAAFLVHLAAGRTVLKGRGLRAGRKSGGLFSFSRHPVVAAMTKPICGSPQPVQQ